tara:strand:+ start:71 stop:586 length:516 start_codon:yes stop_codon:yes gene_type:complete
MTSTISHSIKNRKVAKDVFITPRALAKQHIDFVNSTPNDDWLDPCRNNENGSYYSQMPEGRRDWCEIIEGVSFFDYSNNPNIICCNPPYSILDKWIKKCIELNPRIISMLIGVGNLTARRIEWFEKAGYSLNKLRMLKVQKWYGMSYLVHFEKNSDSIMEIDRKVWYEDKE